MNINNNYKKIKYFRFARMQCIFNPVSVQNVILAWKLIERI